MKYKFIRNTNNYEWCRLDAILAEVLTGSLEIVKKPRKPKKDEQIYWVDLKRRVQKDSFDECFSVDVMRYQLGNCFRTKEEITPEVLEETWQKCYGKYFEEE